jgi:hypothetical protein
MKEHEFTLIFTTDPDEEEADRLYQIFDDGTIATIAGVPQIIFYRQGLRRSYAFCHPRCGFCGL